MAGLRITLGALFLTVLASNADSLDEHVLGRPPLDRLPAWVRG